MPGPRNMRKKKQAQMKKVSRRSSEPEGRTALQVLAVPVLAPSDHLIQTLEALALPVYVDQLPQKEIFQHDLTIYEEHDEIIPEALSRIPFIHDPGDGPRVRDARVFMGSSFAAPPSLDDALCAEFAQEEVLQMLYSILPEETALVLWYNKSRSTARVCPACMRLYRLGDVLRDQAHEHGDERDGYWADNSPVSPYLLKEQELSGLCSPVCFTLAAFHYQGAIGSTWGRTAQELDDETWALLDGPAQQGNDMGLGLLLKMTRCHDLCLGQLLFPELEEDTGSSEPSEEEEENVWREMEAMSLKEGKDLAGGETFTTTRPIHC